MNISPVINQKYNRPQYNNQTSQRAVNNTQSFTGVSQVYDAFCHGVGKHFDLKVLDNTLIDKFAGLVRNADNPVKHFLAVGSVITSGMYMHQTLTNKKMDKDRRQTLAVNQGFTLALSTLGAYTLDDKIKAWWKKKHEQFIKLSENGKAAWQGMEQKNAEILAEKIKNNNDILSKISSGEIKPELGAKTNSELFKMAKKFIKDDFDLKDESGLKSFAKKLSDAGITVEKTADAKVFRKELTKKVKNILNGGNAELKSKLKSVIATEDIVRQLFEPKLNIDQYLEKYGKTHVFNNLDDLMKMSKGFGILRSLVVFAFVYRFFVPLAVVKPTNWLCEKYLEYKKAKQAEKV